MIQYASTTPDHDGFQNRYDYLVDGIVTQSLSMWVHQDNEETRTADLDVFRANLIAAGFDPDCP